MDEPSSSGQARHIVHLAHGFSMGGLENVVAELVRNLPSREFRHTVISLTDLGPFAQRVEDSGAKVMALHKPPGHAVPLYPQIIQTLRALKPDVLHTCNLAALEVVPLAWWAGVRLRVHAEHGWDAHDPHGLSARYRWIRRLYCPFVSRYVAVSADLQEYLVARVGIAPARVRMIPNGVDTDRFSPLQAQPGGCAGSRLPVDWPFDPATTWVVGTVGRMMTVKNQPLLARAFVRLIQQHPEAAARARLVMVGEGPLQAEVAQILEAAGLRHLAWLPGARTDIPGILGMLDVFVLPSVTEGTSCTLQEAMACGLPVVATAVGGTPALIDSGCSGLLVQSQDEEGLAQALRRLMDHPQEASALGLAARAVAVERFGIPKMIQAYADLFRGH